MFPEALFFGIGLYELLMVLGIFLAMLVFRVLADKRGYPAPLQNIGLFALIFAVFVGYLSAVLFQAFYNFVESGVFEIVANTGATFYGGLIGGTLAYLVFYFTAGHLLLPKKEHRTHFLDLLGLAPCCITVAHAVGRLGCLAAGCCYGKETDAFFGVYMKHLPHKVIPTQLFEAIFLFVLFAFLLVRYLEKQPYNMTVYLVGYGVWRFLLEYMRGDDRGETIVPFLTPSQLTAVVLVLGGIALVFAEKRLLPRLLAPEAPLHEPPSDTPKAS